MDGAPGTVVPSRGEDKNKQTHSSSSRRFGSFEFDGDRSKDGLSLRLYRGCKIFSGSSWIDVG